MDRVPVDLASQFQSVRTDVAWLAYKWDLFSELFRLYPQRRKLYTQSHDLMWGFRWIFEALRDDIIMGLGRLTDKAEMKGQENLTFQRILDHPLLAKETRLRRRLRTLEKHVRHARTHRNKRVAHSDMGTSLGNEPLPKIGKSLPEAVNHAMELTYAIELALKGNCTSRGPWGREAARALLDVLRIARWYNENGWRASQALANGKTKKKVIQSRHHESNKDSRKPC